MKSKQTRRTTLLLIGLVLASSQAWPVSISPEAQKQGVPVVQISGLPEVNVARDWVDYAGLSASVFLLLVGLGGVIYAAKTLRQLSLQVAEMQTQSQAALANAQAANESAKAAKQAVELARDTAKQQLRAYVCVVAADIVFAKVDEPGIEIRIKNCGLTPAYNVSMWSGLAVSTHPLQRSLDKPPEEFGMNQSVLAPDGFELMHPIFPLGTAQHTLYVYGQINYVDAFNDHHTTDFRLLFGGPEPPQLIERNGVNTARLKTDSEGNLAK
jgi:hypothetical protein